nr:RNA-directed DNA polymerase, eukaryota [Tanacetum cinerariifolium]
MESITLFDVKCCWGNFAFDHVYSPAVGNSGGILCVWEKSSFKKINSTVSDYFVMIRGTWVCSGVNFLIISVYAPQEFSEKKMLWDYLDQVITKWNGEVIVMGDFNEVWYKNERYGSVFHAHGADAFNSFISNANLQEIHLGGLKVEGCMSRIKSWDEVMEKMRFFNQKDSLWAKVMQAIHRVDGRIDRDGKAGHASIWCDIIKEMDRLATQGIDLVSMMQIKIGNGSNTSFWEDRWRGEDGVEFEQWRDMLKSLDGVLLSLVEDRWKWVLNGSGVFTVASTRQYIDNKRLPGTSSKTRWIKEVPIKVNIHAWKVSLDGLPTRWNISRRDSGHAPVTTSPPPHRHHLHHHHHLAAAYTISSPPSTATCLHTTIAASNSRDTHHTFVVIIIPDTYHNHHSTAIVTISKRRHSPPPLHHIFLSFDGYILL